MKRRDVLGLAGTTLAGALAVSTSAFNVGRVDRSITVAVEEDYDAYLQLEERGSGDRSELDDGKLELNIPGDDEGDYTDQNPEGVGSDSTYWFGRDADGPQNEGLFEVTNNGTNPVAIFSTQAETTAVPSVTMFDVDGQTQLTEVSPSAPLGVGESLRCGIRIDTHGVEVQDDPYDVTLTINAEATSD
jgi:hypothetical protein